MNFFTKLFLSILLFAGLSQSLQAQPPTITSFTPANAKSGDAVTITGTNFNTTTTNNIVFFGATKANVTAATATSLTVTVPSGATYSPITLLNTGTNLATYSLSNFNPIYSPAKTNITATDFPTKQDFTTGTTPFFVAIGDLDGDGKPDLAVANFSSGTVSLYLNTSTGGSIGSSSFAAKQDIATGTFPTSVSLGDLDGDGKLDLAVTNRSSTTVSILRNTSTSGNISFAAKQDFTTGAVPYSVIIGDIDGDGKPDLASGNYGQNEIAVFRNTSTVGSISFAARQDIATAASAISLAIGDIDGDNKPDLAVANYNSSIVSVFRSTSTSGTIAFAARQDITVGTGPYSVAIGDLDGDNKPDLAVATHGTNSLSILRNTSSIGSISYATQQDFTTGTGPSSVTIADIDGDGKPDLAVTNDGSSSVSIFRNTSSSGAINLVAKQDFTTGFSPLYVAIGDLDGDGKPDLVTANSSSGSISVFRNADPPPPTISSFSPTNAKPGDAVTITGTNFNTTTTNNIVFFGATRATVTAATATSLTATVPTGATYAPITVLNIGSNLAAYSLRNFTPKFAPAKTSITASDFATKVDFTTGPLPWSVAIGDLDGDGKPDLAIVYATTNNVSVFRNTSSSGSFSSGSFATKVDFATGVGPSLVTIGDLDGDGKPELVVTNAGSGVNTLSVYRNTSTSGSIDASSFATKVDFTTGSSAYSVAIGDLDGDGKPDLATANLNSNSVSVLRNTSTSGIINTGSFATKVDFTTGTTPRSVAIGDLDGDGKPDLAVTNDASSTVSVFRNTSTSGSISTGSFAAKQDFTTGTNPYRVAIGDLDGDGKPDLAVVNYSSSTVSVFRNTSSSGSIDPSSFAGKVDFTTGTNPTSIAIGDLDADGKADMAISNVNSTTVSLLRNTATNGIVNAGSFAAKVDFTTGVVPYSVAIGDLDGDGKPDLVTTNRSSSTFSVLRNADIVLAPTITTFTPANAKPGDAVTVTGTSFNTTPANNIVFFGATRATVTAATATSLTVTVPAGATYAPITVLNTGTSLAVYSMANFTPTFSPALTNITATDFGGKQDFTTGGNPYSVAIGDLDGDGKPDLAVANGSSNTVSLYRNTSTNGSIGAGSFAAKVDFTTGSFPIAIAIGDVDGDGKLDLITANYSSNNVSVLRNTASSGSIGSGSFAAKIDFSVGTNPWSIAIGDLDGDGKIDLAVGNYGATSVSLLRNTSSSGSIGSGSFAAKVDFTAGSSPRSIAIGDLDADGKPDLAVANQGSSSVSLFRNTSSSGSITTGSFAAKVDFTTGTSPYSVAIGDLDGDGKADLAVANSGSATVSIFRNTASSGSITSGSFATKVDFTTGTTPASIAIGDLDGDGKADLVVANSNTSTNSVSVLRNTSSVGSIGSGSFAAQIDFATGSGPQTVAIGDLDGDGKPNIVVGNTNISTISVLHNALPPTISSFTPANAKPGDAVTITGTNFNTTPANNIVFFGATKATVSAATATSLTVTVPTGATYGPISELNTGFNMSCISLSNFNPIYTPVKSSLSSIDFATKVDFAAGTNARTAVIADLDGDGKSELIVANNTSNTISVFRNISASGNITASSFATKLDFAVSNLPINIAVGDLDGDGKPDLVIATTSTDGVSVLRNTSSSGNISFASNLIISTGTSARPQIVSIGDLDGDGKSDLAIAIEGNGFNSAATLRNTSTIGNISFGTRVDLVIAGSANSLAITDVDLDGKLDLVGTKANGDNFVFVFRNISSSGSINFATRVDFASGNRPQSIVVGDLDGDGKPDLVTANRFSSDVSILRNTSTPGQITSGSFATKLDFTAGTEAFWVAIGDLDGDSKPDLAISNRGAFGVGSVSVLRNTSTSGTISYSAKLDLDGGLQAISMAIGDLDGDGKPDLVVTNDGKDIVTVIQNTLPQNITITGTLAALTTTYGSASSNTSFNVSGTSLTNDIVVTAPAGFEISITANSGFGNSVSLTQSGGVVASTTIFVRLIATNTLALSPYSGNIVCTSTNSSTVNVSTVSSTVTKAPLTITGLTANNKEYDATTATTLGGTAVLSGVVGSENVTVVGTATATFNTANVGTGKTVTVTGYTLGGTSAGNYTVSQPTGLTANITAKALTITGLTASNKEYDAATSVTLNGTAALSGVVGLDNVTVGGTATATFNTANVGTNKTVAVTGYILGGTEAGNYTVSQPTGLTANITAKALTITGLTANNKEYDATTATTLSGTAALSAVIGSENVTVGGTATATFNTAIVGTNKTVTVTGYTLGGPAAGNYIISQPTGLTANITAKALTITGLTASNKEYDATSTASLNGTATLSGVVGSDNVTLVGTATATFNTAIVGISKTVTVTGYTLGGTAAGNYTFSQPTGLTANIIAKVLTIAGITANNKVFDGTTAATLSGTPTLNGILGAENVTVSGTAFATFASSAIGNNIPVSVAGYTIAGTAASNYTVGQPQGLSANITSAPVVSSAAITLTGTFNAFTSCVNSVSASQNFTVSGINLLANVTLNSPTGYELSTSANGTYFNTLQLVPVSGSLASTAVFVRLNTNILGSASGNIVASSLNATNQNLSVSGILNALPIVSAITGGTSPVCIGSTINLNSATSGGIWSSSDVSLATINSTTAVVTGIAAGNPNIIYTVTNINGCISSVISAITVNALPALTTITGPSTVCQGNTITQSNSTSTGVWSSGNTSIATVNNSGVVTGITAGIATINYIVTNANNCSITNTKNLTVLSQPARTPIIKDTLICKATSFTVDATIPSTATYTWAASSGGFTSALPKIIISNPALYRLNITLSNGCFYLDSINLRNTADTAIRTKLQVTSQGFINDNVVTVNLTNPSPQTTTWNIPNGAQVVSQSTTFLILKFSSTGKYQIGLNTTSNNVCSSSDSGIVIISNKDTAVTNTASVVVREVIVAPNPSNGIFNFTIKLNKSSKVSLRIYSITGILTYSTVIPEAVGITSINKQVDITSSQRNTYFAVIQTADSYEVRTLIKN